MEALARESAFKPFERKKNALLALAFAALALLAFAVCGFFAFTTHAGDAHRLALQLSPSSESDARGGGAWFFDSGLSVGVAVEYREFVRRPIAFYANASGLENESSEVSYFVAVAGANYSANFTILAGAQLNSSVSLPEEAPAGVYVLRVDASAENKSGSAQREFYYHEGELVVDAVLSSPGENPGEYEIAGSVSFAQQRVPFAGVNVTLNGPEQGFYENATTDEGVFEQRVYASAQGDYEARVEAWKNDYYGEAVLRFSVAPLEPSNAPEPCPAPVPCAEPSLAPLPSPSIPVIELSPEPTEQASVEASAEASAAPSGEPFELPECKKTGLFINAPLNATVFREGDLVSVSGTLEAFLDKHKRNYHVIVFWGDGSQSNELTLVGDKPPWNWDAALQGEAHEYAAPGNYSVSVYAFHARVPGKDCANASVDVSVASEMREYNATPQGSFAVGENASWQQSFAWPSGAESTVVSVPLAAGGLTLPQGFSFAEAYGEAPEGERLISVTAPPGFSGSWSVEYETPAPGSQQQNSTQSNAEIEVFSPAGLPPGMHYSNVSAYAELPTRVRSASSIHLYLLLRLGDDLNGLGLTPEELRELNETGSLSKATGFATIDADGDGLIDEIGWTVPRLSKRKYGINITILNVHSNPQLYGNWTVFFETSGTADLVVTATRDLNYSENWTRWTDWSEDNETFDLRFLEIKCGETVLPYEWLGANCSGNECSARVANFSCNETASESSKVLTPRKHVLRFDFGNESAFAYNDFTNAHMILLWNGTAAQLAGLPWTCISCGGTDPFNQKFLRADAAYGSSGGNDYHWHSYNAYLGTASLGKQSTATGTNVATPATHGHAIQSVSNTSVSNYPPYYDFLVIRSNVSGIPAVLPACAASGAGCVIAFFNSTTLPENWTQFSAANSKLIRGNASATTTGGSWTHTHTLNVSWTATSNATTNTGTTSPSVAVSTHTHDANTSAQFTTPAAEVDPTISKVVIAFLNASGGVPNGLYAFWNATPPDEWTSRSASGQDYYQDLLYATTAYGSLVTSNNASHTHASKTDKTAQSSGIVNYVTSAAGTNMSSNQHIHLIYWTDINTTDSSPSYYTAILASYANTAPNVSLTAPSNGSTQNTLNVDFNFTPIDNSVFHNCTLLIWYGNGTFLNNTTWNKTAVSNNTANSINYTFVEAGWYKWNAECWDNGVPRLSNQSTSNYSVYAAPLPQLTYRDPTPGDGSINYTNYAYVNVSSDIALVGAKLNWTYSNGSTANLTMTISGGAALYAYLNHSTSDGNASYWVYAVSAAGAGNYTGTRSVFLDYENVTHCRSLYRPITYYLLNSISSNDQCLVVEQHNLTINCRGYNINFSGTAAGRGIYSASLKENLTVTNCSINQTTSQPGEGVYLVSANNTAILDSNITGVGNADYYSINALTSYNSSFYNVWFKGSDKPTKANATWMGNTVKFNASTSVGTDPNGYANVSRYLNVSATSFNGVCGGSLACINAANDYTTCTACSVCTYFQNSCEGLSFDCTPFVKADCTFLATFGACIWDDVGNSCKNDGGGNICNNLAASGQACTLVTNTTGECNSIGDCNDNGACADLIGEPVCSACGGVISCSHTPGPDVWVFLNVSYDDADVPAGFNASNVSIFRYSGAAWSIVSGTGTNRAGNYSYANLTAFSEFAPFAKQNPGEVTSIAWVAPTYNDYRAFNDTQNWTYYNVSFTNTSNMSACNVDINGTNYSMTITGQYAYKNYTPASYGNYSARVYCNTTDATINSTNQTSAYAEFCRNVTASYSMVGNASNATSCYNLGAHNVVFDCRGKTIDYSTVAGGIGFSTAGYQNFTLKNCILTQTALGVANGVFVGAESGSKGNGTIISNNSFVGVKSDAMTNASSGVYLNTANNVTVYNNSFTCGVISRGIHFYRAHYNPNVTNNSITLSGLTSVDGIYVYESSFNNVSNNTIVSNSGLGANAGINLFLETTMVAQSCKNNTVSFNYVNVSADGFYGIKLYSTQANVYVRNNSVFNNTIYVNGGALSAGIYAGTVTGNNTFSNNTINVTGVVRGDSYGIYLSADSGSVVEDNVIYPVGSGSYGLKLEGVALLSVNRNRVYSLPGGLGIYGILVTTPSTPSNFSFNNVTLARAYAVCFYLQAPALASTAVNNNTLDCSGADSYALVLQDSAASLSFGSNNVRGARGIYLSTFNSSNFTNNTVNATGSATYALELAASYANRFVNNTFRSAFIDFYADSNSANNTGINNSFRSSSKPTTSSFTFWGAGFYVNSSESPASDPGGYSNVSRYLNVTQGTAGGSCSSWLGLNCGAATGDYVTCSACTQCDASGMTCGDAPTLNCRVFNGMPVECASVATVCTWDEMLELCNNGGPGGAACLSAPMNECLILKAAGGGCAETGPCANQPGGDCSACNDENRCSTQCGFANCVWTANTPWFYLNVSYEDADLGGKDESALSMWKYNSTPAWENLTQSAVDKNNNYVYANLTSFSVFAPLVQSAEVIDVTFNCSSVNLGTGFLPNTANGTKADTQQCNITIYSNTNVAVDLSVNASDFAGTYGSLKVANVTVSNNSGSTGSCRTELANAFYSGNCGAYNYTDWVNIPDPSVDVYRNLFFFVNVPNSQRKDSYAGTVYVKAVKHT